MLPPAPTVSRDLGNDTPSSLSGPSPLSVASGATDFIQVNRDTLTRLALLCGHLKELHAEEVAALRAEIVVRDAKIARLEEALAARGKELLHERKLNAHVRGK